MISFNDKISIRQLQILLILDIFGTGVIVLPRRVGEVAGQDGWIGVIITTLIAMGCIYLISSVGRMFPEQTFLQYCSYLLSKPVAVLISMGLVVKFVIGISLEIRIFAEIVHQTMLYHTPFIVIFLGILVVSAYAAAKGYEARARLGEILIYIVFIPLIFVFIVATFDVDFTNILPIMETGPEKIFSAGLFATISFKGIEVLLLTYPFINKPEKVRKASVQAVGIIGICMVIVTIITIGKFGPHGINRQMWPVLEIMDTIDFPGAFLERQDALILSVWIISIFSVVSAGLFFSSLLLKDVFKKGHHSHYILAIVPIASLIAYIPNDIEQAYEISQFIFITFGTLYMFAIPLILLIIGKIKRRKKV